MTYRISLTLIFLLVFNVVSGQSGRVEKSERLNQLIDRYEVKYGHFDGFMGLTPYSREEIYGYFAPLDSVGLSSKEEYDRDIILDQIAEKKTVEFSDQKQWYKHFFENRAYLFDYKSDKNNFWISANPILFLQSGVENQDNYIIRNTRGARIQGSLGNRVYFTSSIYENQSSFLQHHRNTINRWEAIPGNAFYKDFDFNIDNQSYDFLNADGFVGLKLNNFIHAELGHGRHFIGHGMRSMLLSDHATNYFYLRTNTRVWKFNYQNLYAELSPFSEKLLTADSDLLPKKYMAQHLLSFKPNHRLELAIFETVIFSRINNFEFQYLNPIILYRTVEQFLNSTDNVILGAQFKYNIINQFQIYGQFALDEFNIGALREDFNWWGNKFGIQAGAKYIDAFNVDHLDLQLEFNMARPYTYTHNFSYEDTEISRANYSHFSQPLAHPLGANFIEYILDGNYSVTNKLIVNPRILYAVQGIDSDSTYYGADILIDNGRRVESSNQFLLQGNKTVINLYALNVSYEFFRNTFAELNFQYRNSVSPLIEYNAQSLYFGASIRMNFQEDYRDY